MDAFTDIGWFLYISLDSYKIWIAFIEKIFRNANWNIFWPPLFQAMHAVEPDMLINFLPVILNQLFRILPTAAMDEVQLNVVR